jgi:arsenate reductase
VTTLYGISNCDTMRKARRWLDAHGVDYVFHDVRRDGLERAILQAWSAALGWEQLLNRRGTTWRRLPEAVRTTVTPRVAEDLMLEQPAIIKRPVLEHRGQLYLGFSADSYAAIFGAAGSS